MTKPVSGQPKWLVGLIILVVGTLLISGCCLMANKPPVISSIVASNQAMTDPAGNCQILCNAQDPDGDELSYTWLADDGYISGEGPLVIWTAPDTPGAYVITVEVSDGQDGIVSNQIIINVVLPNHLPVIKWLYADWYRLKKASNTPITCEAMDPDGDELTYTWSALAGNFSGTGAIVTWIAPNAYGIYTITVTVTDIRGGETSSSIDITVCSCGSAH
jgi:hypothetical protein